MPIRDFAYVVETPKSFQEALVAVRRAAEARKWGVLGDYAFSEILAAKGFPQEVEVKSLDLCAPQHANRFLRGERLTALCMPCNVVVFHEGGRTRIAALRPGVLFPELFADAPPDLAAAAAEVDREVQEILDEAAA